MWPFPSKTEPVTLTNTLTGKKEVFTSGKPGVATLYSCGPTVYGPAHIGNLRAYVFSDVLARTLKEANYRVHRVINITDVGHLVGDGDQGEDKMNVGAARDNTTPKDIADRYTKLFKEDIRKLEIDVRDIQFPRATSYIGQQIALIRKLEERGFTYQTHDGVYFATEKFPEYGVLGNVRNSNMRAGARIELGDKRSLHDFALWRLAKPNDLQQWDSPWGSGNPGWSIECSAMATTLLGPQLDIHTGGEDHIQIHHNNEIAQSECATGKTPFARIWMHNAFISIKGEKISKSLGNTFTLADVEARGFHPLALRYLFLQAHYRTPLSFSWESLKAAEQALENVWRLARAVRTDAKGGAPYVYTEKLYERVRDDLDTAGALALLFTTLADESIPAPKRWNLVEVADAHLGLSLVNPPKTSLTLAELPEELQVTAREREQAREDRDFGKSDELRIHFENRGYRVEDRVDGTTYKKS